MENAQLRKWILRYFAIRGYTLKADAAGYLATEFEKFNENERHNLIAKIVDYLQRNRSLSFAVDIKHVKLCLKECSRPLEDTDKVWNVINVFQVPQINYCNETDKFVQVESPVMKGLFSEASLKIFMYRRRYNIIIQKTMRHDFFQKRKAADENPPYELKTVEWFLCCTERTSNVLMVGLLVQQNETTYAIEDPTGSLQLDISNAKFHDGLFPEHCFVLIEGVYEDKIFHVLAIGSPPAELSIRSRSYLENMNVFGGSSEYDLSQCPNLKKIEDKNPGAMIVFISDVWLDKIEVLEKLNILFNGFKDHPPFAFILIGNFLYGHKGPQNAENLKIGLKTLGEIISKQKEILQKSRVVLVPGPLDPGSPHILPRPPIPEVLAEGLKSLVPKAVLATNPCRIQYCTREIVIIREDLIKKMCRNTIHFPKGGEIEKHFAKTIISQGTLIPLSPNVSPVYWNFSHCLDIFPLPDLIVTADQYNAFTVEHLGCTVINPGTFMKNGFSFRVYLPKSKEIEESAIPDENSAAF